jgi:hypothetical protein
MACVIVSKFHFLSRESAEVWHLGEVFRVGVAGSRIRVDGNETGSIHQLIHMGFEADEVACRIVPV